MTLTRRALLASTGAAAAGWSLRVAAQGKAPRTAPNLFIGTGGDGHTYPGATLPWGMVQLSPDTGNERWDHCSGYHDTDTSIMGFSHTHLSGTGIGDMLDVLVMPGRGAVKLQPGTLAAPETGYRQRFSARLAEPGYFAVSLANGVRAELTVTERTGWHRYRFPAGPAHLVVDLAHMKLDSSDKNVLVDDASLGWDDTTLTGSRRVHRWAKGRRIHFAMQLSRKPDRVVFYGDGDAEQPVDAGGVAGQRLKAVLHFHEAGAKPLVVRCGISAVDLDGARANLAAEARHWDFDRIRQDARRRWAAPMDGLRLSGGTEDERTIMASALYHALLAPTLFSDVDGRYVGLDRQVHRLGAGEVPAYSTYSLWDTYRAVHPLVTLIAPEQAQRFAADLIRQTGQSRFGPPVWPLQGVETGTMIGWHAVPVLAEAEAKGIGADYAAAWPGIRKRSFEFAAPDQDNSRGRDLYDRLGYVPADKVFESVSRTQEYAYDDWASARIARRAGAGADADRLLKRSSSWKNAIDGSIGFARPRFADGSWWSPYDPVQLGHMPKPWWRDYTEANGWQATFLNQHDVYGLMAHMGGEERFEEQLDALFAAPSVLPDNAPPDIAGLVGQYAHGNEPDQHAAYLYAYAGAPWKTQALVRRLCHEMYHNRPAGMIGNDDCGQMSAWFVFSALGFYPVDPIECAYVFGSPLFERAELQLGGNRRLVVEAPGNGPTTPYVRSVSWNDRPWTKSWIGHADLARGGTLRFEMSTVPHRDFGRAMTDRPPSFGRMADGRPKDAR
jgi:predicted alpha-1,2-mannosidase